MAEVMTASIDLDVCNGHGRCYMLAPEIFDCDDDGYPLVIAEAVTDQQRSDLARAVANCPEKAISSSPAG